MLLKQATKKARPFCSTKQFSCFFSDEPLSAPDRHPQGHQRSRPQEPPEVHVPWRSSGQFPKLGHFIKYKQSRYLGREGGSEKFQVVYSPSDDRARLTIQMNVHTAFVGLKVERSGGPIRL